MRQIYGADLQNVVIEDVFYDNTDNDFATAFDFDINQVERRAENVVIRRAFLGSCRRPFSLREKGNVIFEEVRGAYVEESRGELVNEG